MGRLAQTLARIIALSQRIGVIMDQYEQAYERIGLSALKRQELSALSSLCKKRVGTATAVQIETVIASEKTHEITHREISNAKLVRTIR